MDVVKRICDAVAIMDRGSVVETGRTVDLLRTPGSLLARSLFAPPPVSGDGVVTLTWVDQAEEPLISQLTRLFDVDVRILGGALAEVAGHAVGRLTVRITGERSAEALTYLTDRNVLVEEVP